MSVMKIVQLTPGSGDNFYCENCLRDAGLVKAMRSCDADVVMIPMYLPLQTDKDQQVSDGPLFFGGINVFLQQKLSLFRHTPKWLDRMLDWQRLLGFVGRFAGMTSAKDLGETTMSMLLGANGRQKKELDRLMEWLIKPENKPDVVILSNALLAGLAPAIKNTLGVPVVCLLQDEDGFLDGLGEPYSSKAWEILTEKAKDIDRFVAVSKYYGKVMSDRLSVSPEKIDVVMTGVSPDMYDIAAHDPQTPVIGYLSRMCSVKGLDTLVDAFIILKGNADMANVRLRIAGGQSRSDKSFIDQQISKLTKHGLIDDVEFLTSFGRQEKIDFLKSLSVLCVPEKQPVSCGLYVLEAMAAGVPVVQPATGVFEELIDATDGGSAVEAGDPDAFANAIQPFLLDSEYAKKVGQKGRDAIKAKFDIKLSAEKMIDVCKSVLQRR